MEQPDRRPKGPDRSPGGLTTARFFTSGIGNKASNLRSTMTRLLDRLSRRPFHQRRPDEILVSAQRSNRKKRIMGQSVMRRRDEGVSQDADEEESLATRILDNILGRHFGGGYDFFISYAWRDGRFYAAGLKDELNKRGFRCFLDREDYEKGTSWKREGRRALKRTNRLLLIVTPGSMQSAPVEREISVFNALKRPIWPIDIANVWDSPIAVSIREKIPDEILRFTHHAVEGEEQNEALERILSAGPSNDVLNDIVNSFKLRRQSEKRSFWLGLSAIVFFVLAIGSAVMALVANSQRMRADKNANTAIANEQRAWGSLGTSDLLQGTQDEDGIVATHWFLRSERSYFLANDNRYARNARLGSEQFANKVRHSIPVGERIEQVWSPCYSPNELTIVASDGDLKRIASWNAESGKLNSFYESPRFVSIARASKDGTRLVIVEFDKIAFRSGEGDSEYAPSIPCNDARAVWVMEDLQRGVVLAEDGSLVRWPKETGSHMIAVDDRKVLTHPVVPLVATISRPSDAVPSVLSRTQLWDAENGQIIHDLPGVIDGRFDTGDRKRFLGWDASGNVSLWDLDADTVKSISFEVTVQGGTFSTDGSVAVIFGAAEDGNGSIVAFWSLEDSSPKSLQIGSVDLVVDSAVVSANGEKAFLIDGHNLPNDGVPNAAIVSRDDVANPRRVNASGRPGGACFFNKDTYLATWSKDNTLIEIWDLTGGKDSEQRPVANLRHQSVFKTYREPFVQAVPHANGQSLLSWGSDGIVRVWDPTAQDGSFMEFEKTAPGGFLPSDQQSVQARFSPSNKWLCIWSDDVGACVYNVSSGEPSKIRLRHVNGLRSLIFSGNEREVIAWYESGKAVAFDIGTGSERRQREPSPNDRVVGISDDWLVIQSAPAELAVVAAETSELRGRITVMADKDGSVVALPSATVDHTGTLVAVWDQGKPGEWHPTNASVSLYNIETGKLVKSEPTLRPVSGCEFSQDGREALVIAGDVFHGMVPSAILKTRFPHDRAYGPAANDLSPIGAVFTTQSDRVLAWHWDGFAYLWDTKSGRKTHFFQQEVIYVDGIRISAAINPDGTLLLTSSPPYRRTPTYLWDVETGRVLRKFAAKGGAFSADGTYLAVIEKRGVRVFDLRLTTSRPETLVEQGVRRRTEFEVQTATELIEAGQFKVLSFEEWQSRKNSISNHVKN